MGKMLKEFKDFAMKGNVLDMAVAVIIGGAFGTIITSLVNDIIMPLLGIILGAVNIAELAFTVPNPMGGEPVSLMYGQFLQNILNFILIAFSVFLIVKSANKMMEKAKKEKEAEEEAAPEPEPTKEEVLLTEIRDALKELKK